MKKTTSTQFIRYSSIGVANTLIHWITFMSIYYTTNAKQILCNIVAFLAAVSFSFYANSRWTFNSPKRLPNYIIYVISMGLLAGGTGKLSDIANLPPLATLLIFSSTSLTIGFIVSKLILTEKPHQ